MKTLKLLLGDPAKGKYDPFGALGMEATYPEKKIYIRYARQFLEPYHTVANHFSIMHKKINFDFIILEKNFDYENVSKAFAHLPITYVTTSSGLTEKTRAKGWSVDKPYVLGWMKVEYNKHTIQTPPNPTKDMEELMRQRIEMASMPGPSGQTSYKRQRGRHDDLVSCEILGCNAIRLWWDRQ